MYNVAGELLVTLKEFELSEDDQRIYEELLDKKYSILYFHADEINESKIVHICEMWLRRLSKPYYTIGGKEVSFETREFASTPVDYVSSGEEKVLFDK